jgi:hypothetical protein
MHTHGSTLIRRVLSTPRWEAYRTAASGDDDLAWLLYQWNLAVGAALYAPLHWLEVSLRNAMHRQLSGHFSRPAWWTAVPLHPHTRRQLADAAARFYRLTRRTPGADDLVAALSLGFWVSLLSTGYDRVLWVPVLHRAFRPAYRGPRRGLHVELTKVLELRNRVMHHEPVHRRNLTVDVLRLQTLLMYVVGEASPALGDFAPVHAALARHPVAPVTCPELRHA